MKKNFFYEIFFVFLAILALFTGLSLFSYSASDPSYSNIVFSRYDDIVSNIFGKAGALTADILGMVFGWAALLIPIAFVYLLVQMVKVYRGRSGRGRLIAGFFTALLFIMAVSALSGLLGETDPYFAHKQSGGVFGVTGAVIIRSVVGRGGGVILCIILLLLCAMAFMRVTPGDLFRGIAAKLDELKTGEKKPKKEKKKNEEPKGRPFWAVFGQIFESFRVMREKRIAARLEREKQEARRNALLSPPPEEDASPVAGFPVAEPEKPVQAVEPEKSVIRAEAPPMIMPPFRPEPIDPTLEDELKEDEEDEADDDIPFVLPEGEELLTVSKLEEILNRHDADWAAGEFVPEDLIVGEYQGSVERAAHVKHRVYGEGYHLSFDLLDNSSADQKQADPAELRAKADLLLGKLRDFGVDGRIREIRPGPVVTLFELEPAPGIKINKIANLENDLALAMSAISIRIIAPIPGKAAVGIEVPNADRAMVSLRELLETKEFKQDASPLAVAFGKDISGKPYYSDLRKMPHLLVAGTTGSGKSVCVNTIICSVLYKSAPDKVKFVMIDPKMVELSVYEGIPHLMAPVVTDARKASLVLQNVVKEMEARYSLLASCKVRSIDSYNELAADRSDLEEMPYMVVIVDEFADLMMVAGKEVENSIIRIAQMARAVGIHLVLATQRPSVNVITGIIKANMPARISFRVSSKIDSRTILDQNGAELLLGRGDSLFIPPGSSDPLRIHGSFVSEKEVLRVVDALGVYGEPEYNMDLLEDQAAALDDEEGDVDELYGEAVKVAREKGSVSVSMVQRYLRIGYNRAARIVEEMERRGLIGPSDGTSKPREFIK